MFPVATLLGLVYVPYIWECCPIGWASAFFPRGGLWLMASDFHVFVGSWEAGRGDAGASGTSSAGQGTGGAYQPPGGAAGPHGEWRYIGPPGTCSRHCLLQPSPPSFCGQVTPGSLLLSASVAGHGQFAPLHSLGPRLEAPPGFWKIFVPRQIPKYFKGPSPRPAQPTAPLPEKAAEMGSIFSFQIKCSF